MPSFDAGYYHFTALLPVLPQGTDSDSWRWNNWSRSPLASLRELLSSFRTVDVPTLAEEDNQHVLAARPVPFSMSNRTHFARMVVVEDVAYNGLQRGDTLLDLLGSLFPALRSLINRKPPDHLPIAYLLIVIEFDSPDGFRSSVESYLNELWLHMEQEWTLVLRHCHGFQGTPEHSRQSFIKLLLHYEIETTFGFTGYNWLARKVGHRKYASHDLLPPSCDRPRLLIVGLLVPFAACMIPIVIIMGIGLFGYQPTVLLILIGLIIALMVCWHSFLKQANRPWPREPHSDLKSTLKSLYLQHAFPELLLDLQSQKSNSKMDLRRRFRSFVADVNPHDSESPTLMPGCLQHVRPISSL